MGPDSLISFMKQNQARLQKAADAEAEMHGEAPAAAGKATEVDDGTKVRPPPRARGLHPSPPGTAAGL